MTRDFLTANKMKVNKIVIGNFRQSNFSRVVRTKARMQWIERLMKNREGKQWFSQNFNVEGKTAIGWLERNLKVEELGVDVIRAD